MRRIAAILAVLVLILAGMEIDRRIPPVRAASQFATILCDSFASVGAITANTQIVTAGGPNNFVYICSYNLNASAALTFSIVEGTGTTCATGTKAMVGGTTAANGLSLGIAGTVNYGGGTGAVTKTAVAGDNVCIFPSNGNLSGTVSSTQMPF